jgi:sulfur-oxidizing protein SoxY
MPPSTSHSRRSFIARTGGFLAALFLGRDVFARGGQLLAAGPGDPPEIPNEIVAKAIRDRFGDRTIRTGHVQLDMPAVAEDGRVVPVIIESDLPMTPDNYVKGIHLFVDHNPDVHLAGFYLTPAVGRVSITTRIKMKRTTWVRAVAETTGGDLWADYAHVNVTLNGCG